MKRVLCFLLSLLLVLGAVGAAAAEEAEPQKITIGAFSWQITKMYLEDAAKNYMEAHPGVEVDVVTIAGDENIPTYAIDWARGNTDVDILVLATSSQASQFVSSDLIYNFDTDLNFFDSEGFSKDDFLGVGLQEGTVNGGIYGIPLIVESYALNVNNAAMKEAGLWDETADRAMIPATWDDFYDYAVKLHKVDNGKVVQQGAVIQWGKSMYATLIAAKQAMDGTIYDENGVLSFESENFRHMLEVWKKGADEGVFSKETYSDDMAGRSSFKAGISAMLFETGGAFVEANNALGAGSASLSAFPGAVDNGSIGFSSIAIIPKATKSPKLAVDFLKQSVLSEYSQTNSLNTYGKMPSLARYFTNATLPDWQFLQGIADKSAAMPKYKGATQFFLESPAIIQAYLDGGVSLDDCMANLQNLIDSMDKSAF